MKKSIIGFIFGAILMLSVNVAADTYYQFAASQNTLYVDGAKIEMPLYNYQYTNHAPIRAVAEAVGLDVKVTGTRIDFTSPLTDLETVAKNCKDSCVMIYAYLPNGIISQGSGWVYNGYVITAKHVVNGAEKIDIFLDDSMYGVSGTIHYMDKTLDVAVIKSDTKLPSVILGDSNKLNEGQKLVSITSPAGVQNTIDECVNSGFAYFEEGTYLTISESSMDKGSSGGAIFNLDGELIAIANSGNEGGQHAIPINDIKPILEKLK
jgi:S1-C subfamily serine protease